MAYDTERLKADADCRRVAAYLGIRMSHGFCECPSGTHSETRINHCSIQKEYYHCFSCGAAGDVFSLVKSYLENKQGISAPYTECCRIVGDACGGADAYILNADESRKRSRQKQPFSASELELIGFAKPTGTMYRDAKPMTPARLYASNKSLYMSMARSLAKKELEKLDFIEKKLGSSGNSMAQAVKKRRNAVTGLLKRAGGKA